MTPNEQSPFGYAPAVGSSAEGSRVDEPRLYLS